MDMGSYLRFLLALVFVLGLIALLVWVVRRFGPAGIALRASGRNRRLAIVEVTPVDARRRLVLVRRDGVEHLLLLGAGNDLVIESGLAAPDKPVLQEPRP
jgi:flagellar protein FliO/FliZ